MNDESTNKSDLVNTGSMKESDLTGKKGTYLNAGVLNTGNINQQQNRAETIYNQYFRDVVVGSTHKAGWDLTDLQDKPDFGGLRGLLPSVYHPMFLGRETKSTQGEATYKPQEMPDTGWRESHLHVAGFERLREAKVFEEWVHAAGGGVYLILGEPGSGKSTLLSQWYKRGQNNHRVVKPTVWLDLGKTTEDAVNQLTGLNNQYPLILLDSWDEATDVVQTKIKALLPDLSGVVIVSCRSAVYAGEFDELCSKQGKPYHVMGLQPSDQKVFLEDLAAVWRESRHDDLVDLKFALADTNWCETLWQAIQVHPQIRRLAGSPLLLTLLAYMHPPPDVTRTQLPDNRLAFYERAFDWLCKNRIDRNLSKKAVNELRQFLTLVVNETAFNSNLDELHLRTVFENRFKVANRNCEHNFEEIEVYLKKTGLLKKSHASGSYQFLHKSFQEWLLATALYSEVKLVTAVGMYWQDRNYRNTLALMWNLATPIERHSATIYLIAQGCQQNPHELSGRNRYDSGLRAAIHLWNASGLEMARNTFSLLKKNIYVGQMRKIAVAIDTESCGQLLAELAKDDHKAVRRGVAENVNTPTWLLAKLAKDDDEALRRDVALNVNASAEVLAELANDANAFVRKSVVGNVNAPVELLSELAMYDQESEHRGSVYNVNTPAEVLAELAKDDHEVVRRFVAYNVKTPAEVLAELSKDAQEVVRWGVALNVNTPAAVLAELAKDDHEAVRRGVAYNNTPAEVLAELAKDNYETVRKGVALNINTPAEVLVELAKDDHKVVRRGVAQNVNTPAGVLAKLVEDDHQYAHSGVHLNYDTCLELMFDVDL